MGTGPWAEMRFEKQCQRVSKRLRVFALALLLLVSWGLYNLIGSHGSHVFHRLSARVHQPADQHSPTKAVVRQQAEKAIDRNAVLDETLAEWTGATPPAAAAFLPKTVTTPLDGTAGRSGAIVPAWSSQFVTDTFTEHWASLLRVCTPGLRIVQCMAAMAAEAKRTQRPAWQRAMLSKIMGLSGHVLSDVAKPNLDFCMIQKNSSTKWKEFFCVLHGNFPCHPGTIAYRAKGMVYDGTDGDDRMFAWWRSTVLQNQSVAKWAVLRDPIERFVSAYTDKCERSLDQKHCEPLRSFQDNLTWTSLDRTQKFKAFVDQYAAQDGWNMHFFPQSMYCQGLFRDASKYQFLVMNGTYGAQMQHFRTVFKTHPQFDVAVDQVFGEAHHQKNENTKKANHHKTPALVSICELFDAQTTEKVLTYYALDYTSLGLPLPVWIDYFGPQAPPLTKNLASELKAKLIESHPQLKAEDLSQLQECLDARVSAALSLQVVFAS